MSKFLFFFFQCIAVYLMLCTFLLLNERSILYGDYFTVTEFTITCILPTQTLSPISYYIFCLLHKQTFTFSFWVNSVPCCRNQNMVHTFIFSPILILHLLHRLCCFTSLSVGYAHQVPSNSSVRTARSSGICPSFFIYI